MDGESQRRPIPQMRGSRVGSAHPDWLDVRIVVQPFRAACAAWKGCTTNAASRSVEQKSPFADFPLDSFLYRNIIVRTWHEPQQPPTYSMRSPSRDAVRSSTFSPAVEKRRWGTWLSHCDCRNRLSRSTCECCGECGWSMPAGAAAARSIASIPRSSKPCTTGSNITNDSGRIRFRAFRSAPSNAPASSANNNPNLPNRIGKRSDHDLRNDNRSRSGDLA